MSGLCGLRRTAELTRLARQLYDTWLLINGLVDIAPPWEGLTPDSRHLFIARAGEMVELLKIDPAYYEPIAMQLDDPVPPTPRLRLLRFPEDPHE